VVYSKYLENEHMAMKIERLIEASGYLLAKYGRRLNYTKLIKLLYLADKESLKVSILTITGDNYVCMRNGPVLSGLYDLIKGRYHDSATQALWNYRFRTEGNDIVMLYAPGEGSLSQQDCEILDQVDGRYHDKSYGDMIELVHQKDVCPEWHDPGSTSTPIPMGDIYRSVGYDDEEIAWVEEENAAFDAEDKLFASLATA
jgi:uncharacterized phage-associated protein